MKKYLKEAFLFVALFVVVSTAVSLYRTSHMDVQDDICKKDAQIVYFFGTWCPICKMTSPNVERTSKHFSVLGIAVRSGSDKELKQYLQRRNLDFGVINDERGEIAVRSGVNVYPTVVFCKEGKVALVESGYISTLGIWLRAWITALF